MSLIRPFCLFLAIYLSVASARGDTGLLGWQGQVKVTPVLGDQECHSIHAYFVTSPESPDGKRVLLYRSIAADGHRGEICILERTSGELRVLVENVEVEDAHRAACQQWVAGGRAVAFHDLREGKWIVALVNNTQGARSWRPSHPHPAFSPDGRRIYFNVSDGRWTKLYVAERGEDREP